ncbi:hypothetical protein [Limosilactobacillus sp.]|nr:hypothetical protein [Limosilactobacillus sp.]
MKYRRDPCFRLLSEKVITAEDLNGFSEELRDGINDVVKRLC